MPRGGRRPGAGRPRKDTSDPVAVLMADPSFKLAMLITSLVPDPADQMAIATAAESYARARHRKPMLHKSVAHAVDSIINPKPLITSFQPLLDPGDWGSIKYQK
jgi:hypothetical protein